MESDQTNVYYELFNRKRLRNQPVFRYYFKAIIRKFVQE